MRESSVLLLMRKCGPPVAVPVARRLCVRVVAVPVAASALRISADQIPSIHECCELLVEKPKHMKTHHRNIIVAIIVIIIITIIIILFITIIIAIITMPVIIIPAIVITTVSAQN